MTAGKNFQAAPDSAPAARKFTAKACLSPEERSETLGFLQDLAATTFIAFETTASEYGRTLVEPGKLIEDPMTDEEYHKSLWRWHALPRFEGDNREIHARIALSKELLHPFFLLRKLTVDTLQKMWFRITHTVLHELAHAAAGLAYRGRLSQVYVNTQPFLNDELCAEVGYAYENYVFGGMIDVRGSIERAFVVCKSWPKKDVCQWYESLAGGGSGTIKQRGDVAAETVGNTTWDDIGPFFGWRFWARSLEVEERRLRLRICCYDIAQPEDKTKQEVNVGTE